MVQISPLTKESASVEAQTTLTEIEKVFGQIPLLFLTMAHFPPLLQANWQKYQAVMLKGSISRQGKETIALLVSQDNHCNYCVTAHRQALKALKLSEAQLKATIEADLASTGLSEKEIKLVSFARLVNSNPHGIPDPLFEELKKLGATSAEIIETLGVVELFVGFNKFLDTLKVEIDFSGQ